uniref:Uncharacterized protein n=1 Tax=Caenorhabditis japonica TaxID=281687 RepID=A0A8R1DUT3_CAEJA
MLAFPHSTGPMLLRRGAPMNTDADVDCTLYEHIRYRPYCQTIRLEKRRRAASRVLRRRRLPTIQENLCMFEWLHRTEEKNYMA